ncbi:hypothetical protein [Spirosoma gilvum]
MYNSALGINKNISTDKVPNTIKGTATHKGYPLSKAKSIIILRQLKQLTTVINVQVLIQ